MPMRVQTEIPSAVVAEIDTIDTVNKILSGTIEVQQLTPAELTGIMYTGYDGSAFRVLNVDTNGNLYVKQTTPSNLTTSPYGISTSYYYRAFVTDDYLSPYAGRLMINLHAINGTVQTARDWSADFAKLQNLDTTLSSLMPKTGGTVNAVIQSPTDGTTGYLITHVANSSGTIIDNFGADPVGIKDTTGTQIDPMPKTGGTVGVAEVSSTVDVAVVNHSVMTPVDVQARYYSPVTLWSSTNVTASSTNTSDWVDISTFYIKTFSVYSTVSGTLIIEVSPTSSTATAYEYYRDNSVSANTFTTKSFTEVFYYARLKFVPSADGTLTGYLGMMS